MNDCPNPVIKTTPLRAYPGWIVREYADGMFDGTNGIGLTLGCKTFAEVIACIKQDR